MELVDNFDSSKWETSTEPENCADFIEYTIITRKQVGPTYQYAVREIRVDDQDCEMAMVVLDGLYKNKDPLKGIRNCDLIVRDKKVVGVRVEDEAVMYTP